MNSLKTGRGAELVVHGAGGLMQTPRKEGRLSGLMRRLLMRRVTVTDCECIAGGFHLVTLESPDFTTLDWTPGDKIQIAMGSAFVARTYTPIDLDPEGGRMRVLVCTLGDGPGSDWVRSLVAGDVCDVFGPRASLDVSWVPGPAVLLGDETSFGIAMAMSRQTYASSLRFIFEVTDGPVSRDVLRSLKFGESRLVPRRSDDSHISEIEALLPDMALSVSTFILTGRSTTVQRVRQALRSLNVPSTRIMAKAYWASGKSGLD